jgi:ABC-type xylose transport system permease subunit
MFVSYFGTLVLAVLFFPGAYNWCDASISTLLYPRNNPEFHFLASIGIAVAGLLMIPFAGYINRRLRIASPVVANAGTIAFAGGVICLILAGLIVSHPLHGRSSVPRLHSILARTAALGIGMGMVMFDACAVKGHFNRATGKKLYRRSLIVLWSLAILPVILAVVFGPVLQTHFWHLGFWEWIGSASAFLFLVCSVWLLPEHACE